MTVKTIMAVPTESEEQQAVFEWARLSSSRYPCLKLLYHIPNEGKRSRANGAKLKREGLKSGVPDICLPVAKAGYNALYIELKRIGEKASQNQEKFIALLLQAGNLALVCEGADEAIKIIQNYIKAGERE